MVPTTAVRYNLSSLGLLVPISEINVRRQFELLASVSVIIGIVSVTHDANGSVSVSIDIVSVIRDANRWRCCQLWLLCLIQVRPSEFPAGEMNTKN